MIQRKRFRTLQLACLITAMTCLSVTQTNAAEAWEKSNGVYLSKDGTAIAGVVARGIDVSHWKESIDWNAVVNDDVSFVMLGTRYENAADPYFKTNAVSAAKAGLKVGAYLYSYATTTEMAKAEADFVLNLIKDYPISYPVVFDVEASELSALTPTQLAEIINAFCQKIKDAGYYPMLYANDYWLNSKIDMSKVTYDVWAARYDTKPSYSKPAMWQATNQGSINGISGYVDINFSYKDYSSLIPANIWREINGNWYYYADYTMQTGWINDGNGWYYMKEDGTQHKGWLHIGEDYFYLNEKTGKMHTGWRQDSATSKWYYFGSNGAMRTGWIKNNDNWYYLNSDGTMATKWLKLNNDTYYYLKDDGVMVTGWYQMDDAWYYFNPSGELLRGWCEIEGKRYYLAQDGKMASGWTEIDGKRYFFGSDGSMRTGWRQTDQVWYYLNEQGQMLTGWQLIDGEYYYLHEGQMLTGWVTDANGNQYYMDPEKGTMSRSWKKIENDVYYFNQYGHLQKGWLNLSGTYYYLDPETGKRETNGSRLINNVNYTFDQNGVLQNETNHMSGLADSYFDPNTTQSSATAGSSASPVTGSNGTSSAPGSASNGTSSAPGSVSNGTSSAPGTLLSGTSAAPTGSSMAPDTNHTSGSSSSSVSSAMTAPGSGNLSSANKLQAGLTGGPGK